MVSWESLNCTLWPTLWVRAVWLSVVTQSETDISVTSCETCINHHCECWFWNWYGIPSRAAHHFHWYSRSTPSLQLIKTNMNYFYSSGIRLIILSSCSWGCCGACLALGLSGRDRAGCCCYLIIRTVGALHCNLTGEYLISLQPPPPLLSTVNFRGHSPSLTSQWCEM